MKTTELVLAVFALFAMSFTANAQSMSTVMSLYNQGHYQEAARHLRPLADGGNAEAQCMAASMFFEGKGVAKNDAQGIHYAKLAANQGYEDAIVVLAKYYKDKGNYQQVYSTVQYYLDRHPYMLKQKPGAILAELLMEGQGVERDEERAWQLLRNTPYFNDAQSKYAKQYQNYLGRHPEEKVYEIVEVMPIFPGGQKALAQFVSNNLRRPNSTTGRVIVTFIIEKDGTISSAKVLNGVSPELDAESLRVVNSMPKWTPGKQNGEVVRVKFTIPITFR